ncbi:MAG: FAD:protein FMN transferase [Deltaproteobacteria bacterium]|nr:MAG: FAD:protein FMN transferase [Deltaproteobacteria bacterium]
MIARAFEAMGTSWWVACDTPSLLPRAEAIVRDAEDRLSRFRPRSALSRLNRERAASDPLLVGVLRVALRLRELTGGAFDPAVGARVAALGYDRTFTALGDVAPAPRPLAGSTLGIVVEAGGVRLEGAGEIDLGGVAKGFTVDLVVAALRAGGARRALVDGGGDLHGFGAPSPIGVGGGYVVPSSAGAIATSSALARRWRDTDGRALHHVVDPRTGWPADTGFDTAVVIAPDTATADGLATALLADPRGVLPRIGALGVHALLGDRDGAWWMTPGTPLDPRGASRPAPTGPEEAP